MSAQTLISDLGITCGSEIALDVFRPSVTVTGGEIERLFLALADDQREQGNDREALALERIAAVVYRQWMDDPCD